MSDGPVMTERELPRQAIDIALIGKNPRRAYIEADGLALWLSLIIEEADEDERWVLRKIRDQVRRGAAECLRESS